MAPSSRKKSSVHRRPKAVRKSKAPVARKPRPSRKAVAEPAPQEHVAPRLSISHILVPIDFSVHSRNALKYAVPLAGEFSASLHLVYVVEPTIYPADLGFGQVVLPGVEDELRQKASEELQQLIEREIGTVIPATASVRTGSPHQEILDEADERNVDLIVVASHGHSGVEQILFGSTADRIVHNAKCPVLTVRPVIAKEGEA
ncbi:MAG TPA: universal stress protein [Bacteroidota bacterium]|nr:universal stress protein [Bacteroidota bacterium]